MHGCYVMIVTMRYRRMVISVHHYGVIIFHDHPSSIIILYDNMHHHHFPLKLYWPADRPRQYHLLDRKACARHLGDGRAKPSLATRAPRLAMPRRLLFRKCWCTAAAHSTLSVEARPLLSHVYIAVYVCGVALQ